MTALTGTRTDARTRVWAAAAATAAAYVPADGAEAALWTVRGWTEVALGCLVLDTPDAVGGLDDVVCASGIRDGGRFAASLHRLRCHWGPVPAAYPVAGDPGRVRPVTAATWQACLYLGQFCDALAGTSAGSSAGAGTGRRRGARGTAAALRWGERWRPSPNRDFQIVASHADPGLIRRSWMWLPGHDGGKVTVVDSRPPRAGAAAHVWRGIHDGAHLDHLAVVATRTAHTACDVEFGEGLLAAESYAMAVEIVAAAESARAGDVETVLTLRAGLVERIGRLPGYQSWAAQHAAASPALNEARAVPANEFVGLPTLAESYVLGPLLLLARGRADTRLPADLTIPLARRWTAVCQHLPPAAVLTERSARLL